MMLIVLIDLVIAFKSYRKGGQEGLSLALCSALSAIIAFTYLGSVVEEEYRAVSVMSSVYFIGIDWMLVTLLWFVTVYTNGGYPPERSVPGMVVKAYAIFDTIIFAINPFKEIAISYVRRDAPIAFYAYAMKPLYQAHLVFNYLLIAIILIMLLVKIARTPKGFHVQYTLLMASVLLVVAVNTAFIVSTPEGMSSIMKELDSSIPCYTLGLIILYWCTFRYRPRFLKDRLSRVVVDNLDQGIALFDFDGNLMLANDKIGEMIPALKGRTKMKIEEFESICGINRELSGAADTYSRQFFRREGDEGDPLRMDYMRMRTDSGREVGELFTYTNAVDEFDLLTGFHNWDHFRRYVQANPEAFRYTCAVAEFDIAGLSRINNERGREAGDHLIRDFADIIRRNAEEGSYLVRGDNAHMIIISYNMNEDEMRALGERIMGEFSAKTQAGYSSSDNYDTDIITLVGMARRALMNKKLLDEESSRSQTIKSLVRTLRESDSNTEAHVRRTQHMGRELGRRIGLSDLEQSQLSLLCLLHDIGKVGIPLEILNKPGRLTHEEWEVIKSHTTKGYLIALSSSELRGIAEMILYHHERWDGKGYPDGLSGKDIPLLSRIIAVVDSFDAMVNDRSYRSAIGEETAMDEMRKQSGAQFDPELVEAFLRMVEEDPSVTQAAVSGETGVVIPTSGIDRFAGGDYVFSEDLMGEAREGRRPRAVMFSRYTMDIYDHILSVDNAFEEITGYSKEDVSNMGLTQSDLIPEEQREEYFVNVGHQLDQGDVVYMEHEIQRKDGRRSYVLCSAKRQYNSATKTIRTEVIIVDSSKTQVFGAPDVEEL